MAVRDSQMSHSTAMLRQRRRVLRGLAGFGLAGAAPATWCDATSPVVIGAADCANPDRWTTRLFVPGTHGYLGRLRVADSSVALVAGDVSALPDGVVHGTCAYSTGGPQRKYLNPTLVVRQGTQMHVTLDNQLDAPTIVHWHGLTVDTRNDGAGATLAAPGERYEYAFDVRNRGGLYWYHPHPHGTTAGQTYDGLYGVLEIEDDAEIALRKALDLTPGQSELLLVFQDRRNGPRYAPSAMDKLHGLAGDEMYVNGTHCAFHDVGTRLYRLRLLNACNARTLRLAFRTAAGARVPFLLIGTDGGLLESPQRCEQAFFAAAERLDVLLDLRAMPVGETIVLESLAFDPMDAEVTRIAARAAKSGAAQGTTGNGDSRDQDTAPPPSSHHAVDASATGDAHASAWPEGAPRPLLEFRVREPVSYDRRVPAKLSTIASIDLANARERPLRLGFNKGLWRINDRVFAMDETPIEVARGTTEIWLLRNYATSMPHAMHLHGFHFEVLERETSPDFVKSLAIDEHARLPTDLGHKDTVLVWPGESVRIAVRFDMPFTGDQRYVFHCHNLEHEDGGMMLGVKVT
jgi:suppressor of ftsI/bilirubin oxidase